MTLSNPLDLLYFILAIAAIWIAVMLTWLLFEAALMLRRANTVVKEAMDRLGRFERSVLSIKDRLESSASYLGAITEGGKVLMGYLHDKQVKKATGKRRRKAADDEDEDEE
jgi:hypothetical protein